MPTKKEKLKGKWFKGDMFAMSSADMRKAGIHEKGVKKPTALQTKKVKGQMFSRFYHKPVQPGEFWD